jgi:uncharacterized membrane protein
VPGLTPPPARDDDRRRPVALPAGLIAPGASRTRHCAPARSRPADADGFRPDPVAWLIAAVVTTAYATISLARYVRLQPGSWDLGIYTEDIKQFAHLRAPIVAIRGPGFNLLGDHFSPIEALLAPFFRLFPTPATLLVAQALLTGVSVVPVCRAAGDLLGRRVGWAIGLAYGMSWGLQQMINFDFHEVAFAVPLLAFSGSALVRRRPWAAAGWAMPLVFVKEDQGLTVAMFGLVMLGSAVWVRAGAPGRRPLAGARPSTTSTGRVPSQASWAVAGALLVVWGLGWSALEIAVLIVHFNPAHQYQYWHDGGVLRPGGYLSLGAITGQLSAHLLTKARTTALTLLPVAFLAFGSPLALVAGECLALRFLSTNPAFWGDGFHYSATVMPVVFLAAIDALARIRARQPSRTEWVPSTAATAMAAVAAVLAFTFPLSQLWSPRTYTITAHMRAEYAAMSLVPPGTTVESTLSTLAPLAARDETFWTGGPDTGPAYIVFDTADSGWSPAPTDVPAFVAQRHPGYRYRLVFQVSGVYVFRRIARTGG